MHRESVGRRIALGLAPVVLVWLVWEAVARAVLALKGVPFPTPEGAFAQLLRLLAGRPLLEHPLYTHLAHSLMRWGVGFGLAAGTGLAAGLLLGWWRGLDRVTRPIVYVLQLVPGLAWIPIALLLFGVGERATIFMIFVTALAPVVINTIAGVQGVDPGYVRAAQMMGAAPRSLFFRVLLPAAVPHLLSGLRVGLANGWRVLVAAEMIVGTGTGLGYSILQARWTLSPTQHQRRAEKLAWLLVMLSLGTGCARRETPPAPSPPAAPEPQAAPEIPSTLATPVHFAYQDRIVDAIPIVAMAQGYFQQEGLEVKPSVFSSGPACSEAVLSGAADFGTMGDTTAVIAAAQRAPVKILASHGGGEHRHRILVKKDSPIHQAGDLVGKKVAVKKGTSTYGGLLAWAEKQGLDLKKVEVMDLRPEDMPEALAGSAVDAIVASEPTPSQVEAKGYGRELATLGGLGNTYPVLLVVRVRFVQEHPEAIPRFLRAMQRGADFLRDHPDEAVRLVAQSSGLPEEVAREAMGRHEYAVNLDEEITRSLDQIAQFLLSQGTIEQLPDWSQALAGEYLRQAEAEPGSEGAGERGSEGAGGPGSEKEERR